MRITVPDEQAGNAFGYVMTHYSRQLTKAATDFSQAAFMHSKLSFREFEGARLRIALINGCLTCQGFRPAQQLTGYLESGGNAARDTVASRGAAPEEAYYRAVPQWSEAGIFTVRERLAIEYAERVGLDPHGIAEDEAFWKRFKQHFSDDEIVDLSCCIAGWLGLGRLTHTLGLDGACSFDAVPRQLAPRGNLATA
jgi:alkylhydroperoxidase family enzyme